MSIRKNRSKRKNNKSFRRQKLLPSHRLFNTTSAAQTRYLKRHIDKLWRICDELQVRLEDLEVHSDLMQRMMVTLALQKMGMRMGELRRMIRLVEKEAIADSEVYQLEELFKLPPKKPSRKKGKRKS